MNNFELDRFNVFEMKESLVALPDMNNDRNKILKRVKLRFAFDERRALLIIVAKTKELFECKLVCSTRVPLPSARWVRLTFLSLCPPYSKQCCQ